MSNLGDYQTLTIAAKKVGGPKKLVALIFGSGGVATLGAVIGGIKIKNKIETSQNRVAATIVYTVHTEGRSNEGLLFNVGDTFRVLESDGDAGLIEKIGDGNNPYFVSLRFLARISDYTVS